MSQNSIIIKGARQNNLKNINVIIPRYQLVVITGISASKYCLKKFSSNLIF